MSASAQRYQTREKAYVEVYGRMGTITAEMKNLSESGAFLEILQGDYIPQKGDLIRMTVPLESLGRTYNVNAEVIWEKSLGLGISFLKSEEIMNKMISQRSFG